MLRRFLLLASLLLGAGLLAPPTAFAQETPKLAQECVDAKITTQADCDALLKKLGKGGHKPTDKSNAAPAPKPEASLPKVCTDAGIKSQSECDAFEAAQKAKLNQSSPPPAKSQTTAEPTGPSPAAQPSPTPATSKPIALPKDCLAAGLATQSECDSFHAKQGGTDKSAKPLGPTLAKDCVAAGLTTQAECDALHATVKLKTKTAPDAKPKHSTDGSTPPTTSAAPTLPTPNKGKVTLSADCIAAGLTTQPDCDALHATEKAKAKGAPESKPKKNTGGSTSTTTSATPTPPTTEKGSVTLSPDCIAAGLATQADCDALHATEKSKTQIAPGSKPKPNSTGATPAPTNAAPTLPTANKNSPLSSDCITAGLKAQADCDALHVLQKKTPRDKTAAAPSSSAPSSPAQDAFTAAPTPNGKPPILAADCIAANIKTQQDCDAYHLTQAKSLPSASNAVPAVAQPSEVIPVLPKGVTQTQVAPLLDSAKQSKARPATPSAAPSAGITPPPPPSDDKTAQAAIKVAPPPPIDTQPGTPVNPSKKAPLVQLPPNVTVVDQTIINNITTTNVTNNNGGQANPSPQPPPDRNPIGLRIGVVLQIGGGQLVVDSSGRDQYRIADQDRDRTTYDQLSHGRYRETILRPDGSRIVTIYDRNGDILRRSRFEPDGREIVLAYYDYPHDPDLGKWRDPGDDLPPLQLRVPVEEYVLDADRADEGQIRQFFSRPPVEPLHRLYSISEVKRSARLRDIVPRVELGNLTFDTASADLGTDQIGALSSVANAMLALLQKNPAETFLIEGHTDAVGSDASNLVLSDARAASVAQILTEAYHIPPENLTTQGYGAHFLKIQTDGPERLNRRVVIRRITPLVTSTASR